MSNLAFEEPQAVPYFKHFKLDGGAQWADANSLSVTDGVLLALDGYEEGDEPFLVGKHINMRGIDVIRHFAKTSGIRP